MSYKSGESRRDFLTKRFSDKVKMLSELADMMKDDSEIQNEKIKMLTPDGKLVEVDKAVVKNSLSTSKASNDEIFNWINTKKDI